MPGITWKGLRMIVKGMDNDVLIEKILKTEIEYPKEFSTYIEKDFGVLFYNPEKKNFHTANHAVVYPDKVTDFKAVLEEVRDFYLDRGIIPRLYQPYTDGFLMNNAMLLRTSGYDIQSYGQTKFMLLTGENKIQKKVRLDIKELKEWDERIAFDIMIPNNNMQAIHQVKSNCSNPKFRVFAAYIQERAVSLASIFYSDNGVAKLDSLETAEEIRGKGYARELINDMVEIHKKESGIPLYLWPLNVTSERLCTDAGFRTLFKAELASAIYTIKE